MLQLDGIRGLAVAGVLAWHWLPQYEYLRYAPLGVISVRVFFVLSGFLITGILLKARQQNEELGGHWWAPVRHFLIRRTFRIFPLYYAVLLIAIVGGIPAARDNAGWHAAYLTNWLIAFTKRGEGSTGHFWSLAVEEQFYLVWPWVILFASRRAIPWVIGTMLFVGPVYRFLAYKLSHGNYELASGLPIGCLDSLGAGALLAWAGVAWKARPHRIAALERTSLMAGLPLLVLGFALYIQDNLGIGFVTVLDLGVAITMIWVLARASVGFNGPVGRLLQFQPLIWLGTVSYCVYIIHPFIHNLTPRVMDMLHVPELRLRYHLLISTGVTLAVASLSWVFFERPLVRLGRALTPEPTRAGTPATSRSQASMVTAGRD
jgi:peptidoglycan/LPS O-acetylase OafA/YrhL